MTLPDLVTLINLKRKYIAEDVFKTVELPLTDSNGQTILHLVRNDIIYTINVIKDNTILGTFSNIIAFCDDFTIGDCKLNLNAFSSSGEVFNYDEEIGLIFTTPSYDSPTRLISFDFSTPDGTVKEINMTVTRNDIFGNITVCDSSLLSAGGTLGCNVPDYISDSVIGIEIFVNGEVAVKDNVILESTAYGYMGYFIFFIFMLSFILLFSDSKSGILIGILLGFVSGISLGLLKGKIIGGGASGVWLIIIITMMLWKLNKGRKD